MRSIKDFLAPIGWFIGLMAVLLVLFLFLPAVGTATTGMAGNVTAAHPAVATQIWGWTWFSNGYVVMGLVVLIFVCVGLFYIGKAWLKSRYGGG